MSLSEKARELEHAVKNNDVEFIKEKSPEMFSEYETVAEIIKKNINT
jgi:hypothetical protein